MNSLFSTTTDVVDALASTKAFRVVGLGHSEHSFLAGWAADAVLPTPLAAGSYVADEFLVRAQARHAEELAATNRSLSNQLAQARSKVSTPPSAQPGRQGWGVLIVGIILGLLLALLAYHFFL